MHRSIIILSSVLLLAACANKPEQAPSCTGNTLRGCNPVIYFNSGSAVLDKRAKADLDWTYTKMTRFPREQILATGYTDSVGDTEKNFSLSKQRAQAVKSYLVKKGIASDRIIVAFQGEFNPVCTKTECQNLNRRVEVKMSKPNGGWEPMTWDDVSKKMDKVKCFLCEEE